MPTTVLSLGLARKNILDVFLVQERQQERQYTWLLGNEFSTTQEFETMKQMRGLSAAQQINEGQEVPPDDYRQLFTRNFSPVLFGKRIDFTELSDFTNQYKRVIGAQPDFARAFVARRNIAAANVHNLGFTNTTMGMNSEALYSTSHSMGPGLTGSNRPATDIAFSPLGLQQAVREIRKQKSAVNLPMMLTGKVRVMVPIDLEPDAIAAIKSLRLAGTIDNDTNEFLRERVDYACCDYFSSATAWFCKMVNNADHKLFMLKQLPYRMGPLPMDRSLITSWIGRESYIVGWSDWRGTWGTTG